MEGQKAVFSGGGSGIGLAIADLKLPSSHPINIHPFTCDVSSAPDVDAHCAGVQEKLGTPTILICCAGHGIHETLRKEVLPKIRVTLVSPGVTDMAFLGIQFQDIIPQRTLASARYLPVLWQTQ